MEDTKTIFQKIINIISLLMLVGSCLYLAVCWNSIAQEIPVHYDFYGEVDRMGSKNEILALPIVMIVLFIALTIIENHPKMWNTGVEINEKNRTRVYTTLRTMICSIRCLIIFVFSYLMIGSLHGYTKLGTYFLIGVVAIILVIIIVSLLKVFMIPKSEKENEILK